jgi:endonuclease G
VGYPNPLTTLVNRAYTVGYDESRRNPAWSSYRLPAEVLPQRFPRPSRFRTDGRTRAQVRHEDYTGTGFDRGHLTPNHAIATRFGAAAQEETFLMSNIIPQASDLNQGPWRELEATLAERTAIAAREIWVTVGPAYRGASRRLASGSTVPTDCWMTVADETARGPRLQAFLMSQSTGRSADYRRFVTSVDAVERAAQLDLFHELPDALEKRLEAETPALWIDGP